MRLKLIVLAVVVLLGIGYFFLVRPYQAANALEEGIVHFENEQYEAALTSLDRALSLQKENVQALTYKALSLYHLERYDDAIVTATTLSGLAPENPESWRVMGLSYWLTDQLVPAEEALSRYIALDSLDAQILTVRGEVRFALADTAGAEKDFTQSLRYDKRQGIPYLYLARIAFAHSSYTKVVAQLDSALRYQVDSLPALSLQADALDSLECSADLVDVLYAMEALGETSASHYYRLGYHEYLLNRHAASVQSLSQALSQGFASTDAYYYRGTGYVNRREYEKAILDYTSVIEQGLDNEKKESALYNRALAVMHSGKLQKAKRDLLHLQRLKPRDPRVYLSLGICEAQLKAYDASITFFDQALELQKSSRAFFYRGVSNGMLNQHKEAIRDYTSALALQADYREAYFNRGVSYLNLNNFSNACMDLREAARLGFQEAESMITMYCVASGN